MTKQYERIDTIVLKYTDAPEDIQHIECHGTLKREEKSEASGHVRSSEIFGRFQLPEVGKRFNMVAEPFDQSLDHTRAQRIVSTSTVTRVEQTNDKVVYFWTQNSKYSLSLTLNQGTSIVS